ncbi:MAG: hypothetical protein JW762_01885 [Dehalococcoidales bacterium]|nr:hypothetical protein [Dehalococcoidales bacterium]
MKPTNGRIVIIHVSLVLLMSAVAAYCLYQLIGLWTILLFVGLLLTGVSMILFPRIGALPFSLLTFIASLPAVLTHNILDIGKYTNQNPFSFGSQALTRETTFEISFWVALGTGLFLISGYLVLSYLNSLQKEYQADVSGDMDIIETKKVIGRNIIVVIFPVLAGILAALLIIPLKAIQPAITEYMQNFPWSIIVFGLISVLLVGGLLYWIGTSKHKSLPEDQQE